MIYSQPRLAPTAQFPEVFTFNLCLQHATLLGFCFFFPFGFTYKMFCLHSLCNAGIPKMFGTPKPAFVSYLLITFLILHVGGPQRLLSGVCFFFAPLQRGEVFN